jgi:MoxR-like ATPase
MDIKSRISALLKSISEGIYEKDEIISLVLLSSIAGESVFLLGPPGVAKSLIARRLKDAFEDGKAFEYLMSRFSTPDEIFGPVSISKLKDSDKYERNITNYLPDATVVFLDEIWKAGPSIQNTLLTVLNEKIFRNGEQTLRLPMKALISASNELPANDEGLDALWDRFLVRLVVKNIKNSSNFDKMISLPVNRKNTEVPPDIKIKNTEYMRWSEEIDSIIIPGNVFEVIHEIKRTISAHNRRAENAENKFYISDRRWRKIIRLLRTSAFLNGRVEIDLMDCFLITHCLWNAENQIKMAAEIVNTAIESHSSFLMTDEKESYNIEKLSNEFYSIVSIIAELDGAVTGEGTGIAIKKPYKMGQKVYYRILNTPSYYGKDFEYIDKDIIDKLKNTNDTGSNYITIQLFNESGEMTPALNIRKTKKNNYFISLKGDNVGYNIELEEYNGVEITVKKEPDIFTRTKVEDNIRNLLKKIEAYKTTLENYISFVEETFKSHIFVSSSRAEIITRGQRNGLEELDALKGKVLTFQESYSKVRIEVNGT